MSLLDTIKKTVARRPVEKKKPAEKKLTVERKETQRQPSVALSGAPTAVFARGIIKHPHVTEKAAALQQNGTYVFRVAATANKTEIKKSIAQLFGVHPVAVRIARKPQKRVRLGKREGVVAGFKKAIITLKEGDRIDMGA